MSLQVDFVIDLNVHLLLCQANFGHNNLPQASVHFGDSALKVSEHSDVVLGFVRSLGSKF